jgi:hypothetical protein
MTANNYPLNLPGSYIRVQTGYYKKCMQPTVSKEFMELWIPWSAEMLRQDLEPSQIKKIRKFDGFCCVPDHLDYKEISNQLDLLPQLLQHSIVQQKST